MSVSDDIMPRDAVRQFGAFRFDYRNGLSRQNEAGRWLPIVLGGRALDVMRALVEAGGELVTKQALMDAAWPGTAVEDSNLTVQISALRRILDEGRAEESCIQTVIGRGYRFVAPMKSPPAGETEIYRHEAVPRPPTSIAAAGAAKRRGPIWIRVPAGVLAALLATGAGWMLRGLASPPVTVAAAPAPTRPAAFSPQDRRQSVTVLPFVNISDDPAQDVLAAAITRGVIDLITSEGFQLVSVANDATDRGKALDLTAISREHNTHFALTGNARRQDGHLFVSAILYQTYDERPVWARQYDRRDGPDALKPIIQGIGNGFDQRTMDAEAQRALSEHPNDLDKRDLMFVANSTSMSGDSKEAGLARAALIKRALTLDPDYVFALREYGGELSLRVSAGFSSDPHDDLASAAKVLDRALQLAPINVWVLKQKAQVLRLQGDLDGAAALVRKVIARQPMYAGNRYRDLGSILLMSGHLKEALESYMTARELLGSTEDARYVDAYMAVALLANDRFVEAIAEAKAAIPEFSAESGRVGQLPWLALIAAESENGQDVDAKSDLQRFIATPRSLRTIADIQKYDYPAHIPQLLEGLRRAGLPES